MGDADAPAATAFETLSDPVRVVILRELTDHANAANTNHVPFAALRREVGVEDPGRFTYHLDRLQDQFVTKPEDGSVATDAGMDAIGSVAVGDETQSLHIDDGLAIVVE